MKRDADSKGIELEGKKQKTETKPSPKAVLLDSVHVVTVQTESRCSGRGSDVQTNIIAVCDSDEAAVAAAKQKARASGYFSSCDKEYWKNGAGYYSSLDDEANNQDEDEAWSVSVERHKLSSRCDFPESSDEEEEEEDEEEEEEEEEGEEET
jgi:hypothetical protein